MLEFREELSQLKTKLAKLVTALIIRRMEKRAWFRGVIPNNFELNRMQQSPNLRASDPCPMVQAANYEMETSGRKL
jgi:hypothetical protein